MRDCPLGFNMEANIDTEQLISLVQERPALWDKSREDYKSRARTTECWREVCVKLNPAFESLSEAEKNKYGKCTNIFILSLYVKIFT